MMLVEHDFGEDFLTSWGETPKAWGRPEDTVQGYLDFLSSDSQEIQKRQQGEHWDGYEYARSPTIYDYCSQRLKTLLLEGGG